MTAQIQGYFLRYWIFFEYSSFRFFFVLLGDIGQALHPILNTNVWWNATVNDLIHDAEKALKVVVQQLELDPKRISLNGYSEGTIIAPSYN